MTQPERFHELGTRWVRLRMQFLRWIGEQPGEETLSSQLHRLRVARQRRLARKEVSATK